jgi:formate dehydrogenase subunit gamma
MATDIISTSPYALTAEQAETLAQRQVKKHHVAIVLLHWFNAFVWLIELATGSAIVVTPPFAFMPRWYLVMMESIFGSRANLLRVHMAAGLTWIVVFIVYAVFGWRDYLHTEVLKKEIGLDGDDFRWLRVRVLRLVGLSSEALPPQGAYNAGQKLYAVMVYAMVPLIMVTGAIMTFHLFGTSMVQWSMVLHFLAAGLVVSGLMIHVYMGAVFPEERPAFYSMITGMVNELYAFRHHYKWWREVRIQVAEWGDTLSAEEDHSHGTLETDNRSKPEASAANGAR